MRIRKNLWRVLAWSLGAAALSPIATAAHDSQRGERKHRLVGASNSDERGNRDG